MKLTLLDLGVGNLHSLAKALVATGRTTTVEVTADLDAALAAEFLVLPGVGAFAPAAARLEPKRAELGAALRGGLPCLGICLGMQLLFDGSDEGRGTGLGVFAGRVTLIDTPRRPHMGWSPVTPTDRGARLGLPLPLDAYYAHSFACRPTDPAVVVASTELEGDRFAAIVHAGRTVACQFHPEKSSDAGVALLSALVDLVGANAPRRP